MRGGRIAHLHLAPSACPCEMWDGRRVRREVVPMAGRDGRHAETFHEVVHDVFFCFVLT